MFRDFYVICMTNVFHETSILEELLPSIWRGSKVKCKEPCLVLLHSVLGPAISWVSSYSWAVMSLLWISTASSAKLIENGLSLLYGHFWFTLNSDWEPSPPWEKSGFLLTFEGLLNKVQVSLKLKEVFVLFLKKSRKKGRRYGTLPLWKLIYLNGNLAFSLLWQIWIQIEYEK